MQHATKKSWQKKNPDNRNTEITNPRGTQGVHENQGKDTVTQDKGKMNTGVT